MGTAGNATVSVEIAEETLARLLIEGRVCAADFRCLDRRSKQSLHKLCMKSCVRNMATGRRSSLRRQSG